MMECFWANPCVWSLWKMYWYEMGYANNGKDEFNYIKWVYKMWEWCCLAPSYEIFEVLFPRLYIKKAFENSNVYFQSFLCWRATATSTCYYKLISISLQYSCKHKFSKLELDDVLGVWWQDCHHGSTRYFISAYSNGSIRG